MISLWIDVYVKPNNELINIFIRNDSLDHAKPRVSELGNCYAKNHKNPCGISSVTRDRKEI